MLFVLHFVNNFEPYHATTGITELTMEYNGNCPAHKIKVYYAGINNDYPVLCKFKNVNPGDIITCSSSPYDTFRVSTFISIEYENDCDSKRRRRLLFESSDVEYPDDDYYDVAGRSGSSSDSIDESDNGSECIAKFRTNCKQHLVGTQSEGCNALTVVSYVDAAGAKCDDTIIVDDASSSDDDGNESQDDAVEYNALANGERNMESPLKWIARLDPFIRWILLSIFVSAMALLLCSCYFCIVRKHRNVPNGAAAQRKNSEKAHRARLRTLSYGKVIEDEEFEDDDDDEFFNENGQTHHQIEDMQSDDNEELESTIGINEENDSEIEMMTMNAGE